MINKAVFTNYETEFHTSGAVHLTGILPPWER
jgi:hypothetical protein